MKKIYETKVTSIGGREGEVFSPIALLPLNNSSR